VVVGTDIFTDKNYEDMAPSSHNIYVPIVTKNELALLDINSDGYLTMMNDEGEQKEDLKVEDPEVSIWEMGGLKGRLIKKIFR